MFLERREFRPEPGAEEGKAGGKSAKKGGGKKPAAGKKGEAPEQPPPPPENPWLCRAVIDLSPLAQPNAAKGGGACAEKRSDPTFSPSATGGGASKTDIESDSPLRAEVRAMLALVPQCERDAARVGPDPDATKGEEAAAQASVVMAPAAEGVEVRAGRMGGGLHPGVDVLLEHKQTVFIIDQQ